MLQPGFKPLSSCALPLGALAHYCIASLSYNSVPKCITSSLFGINSERFLESTATTHHIVNYPIFCAIREDLYGNVFSYPAALSRVARTQNQRPSSPPPRQIPPWHLVAQAHSFGMRHTRIHMRMENRTRTHSTVKHTQAKCVHREMRRLNKLPSLVQFVISCVLCAAQGAVAAIYPADIFFLPLVCC